MFEGILGAKTNHIFLILFILNKVIKNKEYQEFVPNVEIKILCVNKKSLD